MGASLSYPDVDLSGKVALVTGGNTGIGYETAKGLARMGAHTFIACRSKERAEGAIERMQSELNPAPVGSVRKEKEEPAPTPEYELNCDGEEGRKGDDTAGKDEGGAGGGASGEGEGEIREAAGEDEEVRSKDTSEQQGSECSGRKEIKVEFLPLDLSSLQSTIDCVRLFKEKNLPLHILVNNAAVAWTPFALTGDGYEIQLQVNHLGPMLLTLELLPILLETAASFGDVRICFVSSRANYRATAFNMDKFLVTGEEDYSRLRTYPNTKLYNIMVGAALQRRLKGSGITVSSPEPGTVKTELVRGWTDKTVYTFISKAVLFAVGRSPAQGAATSLNCAVNPKLNSNEHYFYSDCRPAIPNNDARVEDNQERLWKKSIEILKDHLNPTILEKYGPTTIPIPDPSSQSQSSPSQSEPVLSENNAASSENEPVLSENEPVPSKNEPVNEPVPPENKPDTLENAPSENEPESLESEPAVPLESESAPSSTTLERADLQEEQSEEKEAGTGERELPSEQDPVPLDS